MRHLIDYLRDHEQVVRLVDDMRESLIQSGNFRLLQSRREDIYAFATPFIDTKERLEERLRWIRRIVRAMQELGRWLREESSRARSHLLLKTGLDEMFFYLEHGFDELFPIFRLDFVVPTHGPPKLLEINSGCPGGELDPALVADAFLGSPYRAEMLPEYDEENPSKKMPEFHDPRDESLTNLLRNYSRFRAHHPGLPETPTIGLVTSSAQAHFMIPECRGIAAHYNSRGIRALVGDLFDLERGRDCVLLHGEPIHLIFRKFSTLSFRKRLEDLANGERGRSRRIEAVLDAVSQGRICMVNPLGSTYLQDKGLLALLSERSPQLKACIPETHVLRADLPETDPDLWRAICSGKQYILKRRNSFAGRYVLLAPDVVKREAPRLLQEAPGLWVAQRRVPIPTFPFAIWESRSIRSGEYPFVLSHFGRSCFVRTTRTAGYVPLSAHAGSAETCALVINDESAAS